LHHIRDLVARWHHTCSTSYDTPENRLNTWPQGVADTITRLKQAVEHRRHN
jgi:hypothetical protein